MKATHVRQLAVFALVIALSLPTHLLGSTPKIITYSSQQDFEKGDAKGVSISYLGEIRIAPSIEAVFSTEAPFIWCTTRDTQGNVFLAGGNTGQVHRVDKDGTASMFFDSGDQQIYALIENRGALYVATSPEGKVFKVPSGGQVNREQAVFFDPEEVYIWSLAVDQRNNLFVATGEKGNIYKVDQSGKGSLFYESEDVHIRKIIIDDNGSLIAGTSDKGMIIRIDAQGNAFVLYDSPLVEVTDLVFDRAGNLYAAVSGESRVRRLPTTEQSGGDEKDGDSGGEGAEDIADLAVQDISNGGGRFGKDNSDLYQISPEGTVRTFWQATKNRIFGLALGQSDNILAGTGEPGRIYLLTGVDEHTLLNEFEELQVTALTSGQKIGFLAATSNTGRLYRSSRSYAPTGEYVSPVIDASINAQWGEIHWEGEVGDDTDIVFHSRSGNTEEPDKSWSGWTGSYTNSAGQAIESPAARFLQLKATLMSKSAEHSPVLTEFTFSYLQKNIAPHIEEITLHTPGDYYPDAINNRSSESRLGNGQAPSHNGSSSQSQGRKSFRKGFRSVSWRARDENGDDMSYDLFYKALGDNSWKKLIADFHGRVFSWDSELFPDGDYLIKVIASDDASNPPDRVLVAEKLSQPFKVDNSGPSVTDLRVEGTAAEAKIMFVVSDRLTNITTVEYGINADNWRLVYPMDGICDSKTEQFEVRASDLVKGENTIVIKATDALGNVGFGKTEIIL